MSTMEFSMSVRDEHSSKHNITAIKKVNYDLVMTLDNGKVISFDERLVFTHDLIEVQDMYIVRVTKE